MNIRKVGGSLYIALAVCLFVWQMAYLLILGRYQMEYVYNQLFFLINIVIAIFIGFGLWLIYSFSKKQKIIGLSMILVFIVLHIILIFYDQAQVNTIRSRSADSKNSLLLKENKQTGEIRYFRIYYQLFAREKDKLPYQTNGEFKVKWLANDVAAVTYKAKDNKIHQFIGTYGYRVDPNYKNVGPELSGQWVSDKGKILVNTDGIQMQMEGESSHYKWEDVVQFGTLAIVLVNNDEAKWTISLDEDFNDNSNNTLPPSGHITLYKAEISPHEPIKFHHAF